MHVDGNCKWVHKTKQSFAPPRCQSWEGTVLTLSCDDSLLACFCSLDNALNLGPEELKHRKVEYVDIRAASQ